MTRSFDLAIYRWITSAIYSKGENNHPIQITVRSFALSPKASLKPVYQPQAPVFEWLKQAFYIIHCLSICLGLLNHAQVQRLCVLLLHFIMKLYALS